MPARDVDDLVGGGGGGQLRGGPLPQLQPVGGGVLRVGTPIRRGFQECADLGRDRAEERPALVVGHTGRAQHQHPTAERGQ